MRHQLFLAAPARRLAAVAFLAALLGPASPVVQGQATVPASESGLLKLPNVRVIQPDASRSRPVFVTAGVKAFIDDQSGALIEPSFEDLAQLQQAPGHRKPEPKAFRNRATVLPNGTYVLRAPPSMINLSIARVGPGGSVAIACTPADAVPQVFRVAANAEVEQ